MKLTSSLCFNYHNLPLRFVLFLFISCSLNPQTSFSQRIYRQFSTQAVDKQFRLADETVVERRQAIERYVKSYQLNGELPSFTIPIIFHHVYKDNPISPAAIEAQLTALNDAFLYKTEWEHPAHDILDLESLMPPSGSIQFCLADVDLMENGSLGYNYIPVGIEEWSVDDLVTTALGNNAVEGFDFTAYQPENYLNIWIVDLPDTEAGYAQMPWSPKKSDGIVINRQLVEPSGDKFRQYAQMKSLVHLTGSYLGLLELWNDSKPCADDRIFDTPVHNAPNYGANAEYRHISLCDGRVEYSMNYMDATDDNFMYSFTLGQMLRITAMLSEGGPRGSLKDAKSLCGQSLLETEALARNQPIVTTQKTTTSFQISPNPATNQISISYPSDSEWQSFQLFNANGQLLQNFRVNGNGTLLRVDCSHYPAGIYFITAINLSEKQTQRFTLSK